MKAEARQVSSKLVNGGSGEADSKVIWLLFTPDEGRLLSFETHNTAFIFMMWNEVFMLLFMTCVLCPHECFACKKKVTS